LTSPFQEYQVATKFVPQIRLEEWQLLVSSFQHLQQGNDFMAAGCKTMDGSIHLHP
jgi:hypothetical protein